jgi:nicotinamidase-related amidase
MALPNPGMKIEFNRTALVITDPQNDFLSPEGVTWGVVGESVTENNTVDNIETLFRTAKEAGCQCLSHRIITTQQTTAGSLRGPWRR